MASFYRRFVGATTLPKSLSQTDVDESFSLSDGDVEAIRSSFRGVGRLGAGIQLVVLRATGRSLDSFTGLPKLLLKSLCKSVGMRELEIASLRTLYNRAATRSDHLRWVREHAEFHLFTSEDQGQLVDALSQWSGSAISVDDLVKQAEIWLFERRCALPGDRALRDQARAAFAAQDAAALSAIREGVPERELKIALERVFAKRKGRGGGTILDWLRTPAARQSQQTLNNTTHKVRYLKALRVHEWNLSKIPVARMNAYAQSVVHRPPSDTERLSLDTKTVELICFLYVTLLELTDVCVELTARRLNAFMTSSKKSVLKKQAKTSVGLAAERSKAKTLLYDPQMSDKQKIEALQELIPNDAENLSVSHASLIRQTLVEEDAPRVSALLNSLAPFEVRGEEGSRLVRQAQALRDLMVKNATTLPEHFDVSMVDPGWQPLLLSTDRKKALAALKACVIMSVRRGLKGGKIWLAHSRAHRAREDQLIPQAEWLKRRSSIVSSMSLTTNPDKFLERIFSKLSNSLQELAAVVEEGSVSVDAEGRLSIPNIEALDVDPEVSNTRDSMFKIIGAVQQGHLLVEVDARTGFSEMLLGRKARAEVELKSVYGAVIALGTGTDPKTVAKMIPDLQVSQISAAMRSIEADGRLAKANSRVVDFQQSFPITKLWGDGDKASADSMTVDTSPHLYLSRMEYRRKQPGIGIYTHVLGSYSLFYNQPIVLNERQASSAVHGVEHYNATRREDQLKLSILAVDTHGYTNCAMAVAKLLQFDLCVRLRKLSERMLYLPPSLEELPEALDRLKTGKVSLKKIRQGWDELLRLVASIRDGRLTAREALERLGSAAKGERLFAAADELGKLLRTIFLCDYFSKPAFRREMHSLLNKGESVHQLQRVVHQGRIGTQRARRGSELWAISGAHTLLTNCVIGWNTMKMQQVVDAWKLERHPIEDDWVRRMGPGHSSHINFHGTLAFNVQDHSDALLQRQPRTKRQEAQ